jgi:hypothetical protein
MASKKSMVHHSDGDYTVYPQIRETLTPEFQSVESVSPQLLTRLSFSHLVELIDLPDHTKRRFYEMGSCIVTYSYEASAIVREKVCGNSLDVTFCDLHSDGGIQNVKRKTRGMDAWVFGTRRRGDAEGVEDDKILVCIPRCKHLAKSLLRNREEAITANVKGLGYGG